MLAFDFARTLPASSKSLRAIILLLSFTSDPQCTSIADADLTGIAGLAFMEISISFPLAFPPVGR